MVRRYLVVVLVALAAGVPAWAGITGILAGKVTDEKKAPVAGATVRVLGTTRGGYTGADGKYTVLNITAGTYDVRVTAVGYDTVVRKVSISADQTVTMNFTLETGGVLMKAVDVRADREMVRSTDVGTDRISKGEDMIKIGGRDNLASLISLNAGITNSGNNFIVRGSRTTETQVLVDGLTVTDQFTGGLGTVGSTISSAMPSPFATEEVQAKTGGFGAEYGNAVGGIVNTVVKTGRTDRFEGLLRYSFDVPFAWGKSSNGLSAGTPKQDVIDFTFGGPLGFTNSTFFISIRNSYDQFRNFGLELLDPLGNNLGQLPNNQSFGRNITARMKLQATDNAFLLLGGTYGFGAYERSSWTWLYANTPQMKVGNAGNVIGMSDYGASFPERMAKQIVVQEFNSNGFAQWNQTLGENTVFEVRGSFNSKVSENGKRKTPDNPDFILGGWDIFYPEDVIKFEDNLYAAGKNGVVDSYEYLRTTDVTEDGYRVIEVTRPNPITGFIEGPGDFQNTQNPYGLFGYFASRGNEGGFELRKATFYQVDGSVTHNLEVGETRHVFKSGFEFRLYDLNRYSNNNPWDGNPFYDFYGNSFGPNIHFDAPSLRDPAATKAKTEEPYVPMTGAFFVQDQIQFKSLIVTAGLRLDYLDPDAVYRTSMTRFFPIGSDTGFADAKAKLYFGPRLTITYPVSESGRQNFKIAYGIYYQTPPWNEFYDGFNTVLLRGGTVLGNPNLEMQRTNQYEVSYNHQLTDDFALSLTGYYKDIYNQTDIAVIPAVPDPYPQTLMAAYGNAKGIEITLMRRSADNWGFNINYSLGSATGTANEAGTIPALDPFTLQPAYSVEPFPLSFDRRHRVNAVLNFFWGPDEGPRIAGVPFLEYLNINLSGFWQSGSPYTPVNLAGQATGAINSARFPSTWRNDLRITRTIPLNNLIGGNTAIDLFLDVTNLLNYTGAISFYTRTSSPDDDGFALRRVPGDFPSTVYYRDADPKNKVTIAPNQYDRLGMRMYNERADINTDGIVTPDESYAGYKRYVADVVARRAQNYQYPRQVYFGVMFRF